MNALSRLPSLEQKKIAAWTACRPIDGVPPTDYRVDAYGHVIRWADYGSQGENGWEIDHIVPVAIGGTDAPENLRALHCSNNRSRGGLLGNALKGLMTR